MNQNCTDIRQQQSKVTEIGIHFCIFGVRDRCLLANWLHSMADLCLLRGKISAGGEAALTEACLAEDGTKFSVSMSMVRPLIGSTSAAIGVSLAACLPDCSGVTGTVAPSGTSSSAGHPLSAAVLTTSP